LAYDLLVIAVGAENATFNIPGVQEHALFLKDLADARSIRQRIIECFERASQPSRSEDEVRALLHFVVVGGGPTGVEFAAEMQDFATDELRKWFPELAQNVRITLLEATDQILSSFDAELADYTLKHFRRSRINVRTASLVSEVKRESVVLQSGEEIPCGLVVWSTGIGPTVFVQSLDLPKDTRGRLLTDPLLRVVNLESIYAIGDCAQIENLQLPPTAQVAQQAGTYLGKALNVVAKGKRPWPFRYRHMGMLAYIGGNKALADMSNFKGRGVTAWLIWRSAYLTKLVSWRNKVQVFLNWVSASIFGRDISRF
jgi:NADH:ubiquinone reductase (non-electrogenic)